MSASLPFPAALHVVSSELIDMEPLEINRVGLGGGLVFHEGIQAGDQGLDQGLHLGSNLRAVPAPLPGLWWVVGAGFHGVNPVATGLRPVGALAEDICHSVGNARLPGVECAPTLGRTRTYPGSDAHLPWVGRAPTRDRTAPTRDRTAPTRDRTRTYLGSNAHLPGSNSTYPGSNSTYPGSNTHLPWVERAPTLDRTRTYPGSNSTYPGSNAHLPWIECAPTWGRTRTYPGSNAHLPWIERAPARDRTRTYLGSNTHLPGIEHAPTLGRTRTYLGSNAHLPGVERAPTLGRARTYPGSSTHLPWVEHAPTRDRMRAFPTPLSGLGGAGGRVTQGVNPVATGLRPVGAWEGVSTRQTPWLLACAPLGLLKRRSPNWRAMFGSWGRDDFRG
ncbi:hypothetical protein Hsar01_03640 [Haloferula sargassicola]|uniref:Uncharacterized protein n=1 Tax=Haloferula sargassicola TaxID=490096 RepID=A0ABP9UVH8_9BACT